MTNEKKEQLKIVLHTIKNRRQFMYPGYMEDVSPSLVLDELSGFVDYIIQIMEIILEKDDAE